MKRNCQWSEFTQAGCFTSTHKPISLFFYWFDENQRFIDAMMKCGVEKFDYFGAIGRNEQTNNDVFLSYCLLKHWKESAKICALRSR